MIISVRRAALVLAVAVALLLTMLAPAEARPGVRSYRGETSQGIDISFRLVRIDGVLHLRYADFGADLDCPKDAQIGWFFGYHFGEGLALDPERRFSLDDGGSEYAFHLRGRFLQRSGEGTLEMVVAILDENEEPIACRASATWHVDLVT